MQLNAGLKTNDLARRFRQDKRLVIRDVLAPGAADQVYHCLTQEVRFGLAYQDDGGPQFIDRQRLSSMQPADLAALDQKIAARARQGFQYRYRCYPMLDAYLERRDPGLLLHQLFEFINSP
ncbi:MAG: hypothetical protein ACK6A4_11065, partial [Alphaproteobacteria bacterium]